MADRFAARLAREVDSWVREGLVSAEQARAIAGRYAGSSPWLSRPIGVFAVVGGALIAAGVALVVSHNWQSIHRGVKLGSLVALLAAAHLGGLAARERGHPKAGEGLVVAGGGLLLVGIGLIGQIYNLSGRPSDAVLLWWVLLLPAAYALPSMALGALGHAGAAVWLGMAMADRSTVLGAAAHEFAPFPFVAVAAAGIIAFALGVLHGDGSHRPLRQLLEPLGLLGLFAGLIPLGFAWAQTGSLRAGPATAVAAGIVLGLALAAVLAALPRLPADTARARAGLAAALLVLLLYLCAVVAVGGLGASAAMLATLRYLDWLLVFAGPLAFILYGARWDRPAWINWGVIVLGVHALARYVDLVGTMLQASLMFFTGGIFVLLLGWALERMRRRMTAEAAARREGG